MGKNLHISEQEASESKDKFLKKTISQVQNLHERINASSVEGKEKQNLLQRANKILADLQPGKRFDKEQKNSFHEQIAVLGRDLQEASSKPKIIKKEQAVFLAEYKKNKENQEAVEKLKETLTKDLAEVRAELDRKGIFNINFGEYKAIQAGVNELSAANSADFEKKRRVLSDRITALMLKEPVSAEPAPVEVAAGMTEQEAQEFVQVNVDNCNTFIAQFAQRFDHAPDVVAEIAQKQELIQQQGAEILSKLQDQNTSSQEVDFLVNKFEAQLNAVYKSIKNIENRQVYEEKSREYEIARKIANHYIASLSQKSPERKKIVEARDRLGKILADIKKSNDEERKEKFDEALAGVLDLLEKDAQKEFDSQFAGNAPSWESGVSSVSQTASAPEQQTSLKKQDNPVVKERRDVEELFTEIKNSKISDQAKETLSEKISQIQNFLDEAVQAKNQRIFDEKISEGQDLYNQISREFDGFLIHAKQEEQMSVDKKIPKKKRDPIEMPQTEDKHILEQRQKDVDEYGTRLSKLLIEVASQHMGVEKEVDASRAALADARKNIHSKEDFEKHIEIYKKKLEDLIIKIDSLSSSQSYDEIEVGDDDIVSSETIADDEHHETVVVPKKGWWARAKESVISFGKGLVSKEGRQAVGKMAYDTATSLIGVKFVTDLIGWTKGKGDIAQRRRETKEAEIDKKNITTAYENLLTSIDNFYKQQQSPDASQEIEKYKKELEAHVAKTRISESAKHEILQKLEMIYGKFRTQQDTFKRERQKEVQQLLEGYFHSKIERVKIIKDALNFALSATGFGMLRGVIYAGTSLLERARKSSREYAKQTSGRVDIGMSETKFMAKDVFANSAIETARSLVGAGAKKGSSGITRAVDFVRAVGVVARTFGIGSLALSGGTPQENISELLHGFQERGAVKTMLWDNLLVKNIDHIGQTIANPTGGVEKLWHKIAGQSGKQSLGGVFADQHFSGGHGMGGGEVSELSDGGVSEAMPGDVIEGFAAEHHLSEHSFEYLKQFASLKNDSESLGRIIESSHVGVGAHSHFTGSKIDNLIEAGGERRAVVFEELFKHDKTAAVAFLESQHFGKQHLTHLSAFLDKKGNLDYEKFVENYNPNDKKMSLALFRAMQGKENTELANAGLLRAATVDRLGRTVQVKGDVIYLGLDAKGQPILSGDGSVRVRETLFKKEPVSVVRANTGRTIIPLQPDDRLRLNADELRTMKGEFPIHDNVENAVAVNMANDKERVVLAEVETDKARFAKIGEDHVDVLRRARNGTYDKQGHFHAREAILPAANGTYDKQGYFHAREAAANISQDKNLPVNMSDNQDVIDQTDTSFNYVSKQTGEVVGKTIHVYTADEPVQISEQKNTALADVSMKSNEPNSSPLEDRGMVAHTSASELSNANNNNATQTESNTAEVFVPTPKQQEIFKAMATAYLNLTDTEIAQRMAQFEFKGGSENMIYKEIENEPVFKNFRDYAVDFSERRPSQVTEAQFTEITRLLSAYTSGDSKWYAMIDNDELRLMLDPNVGDAPMLANNSHGFRIFDKDKQHELFITDPRFTFVVKEGSLLKMDGNRVVDRWKNYDEALQTARKSDSMSR